MIFWALNGVAFNTHARYQFGLSHGEDGDRGQGWVIDCIKQTVLWKGGTRTSKAGLRDNEHLGHQRINSISPARCCRITIAETATESHGRER